MSSRYSYSKLPTADPDSIPSSSNYGAAANPLPDPILKKKKTKITPRNLRPGLFYQFGERGKFAPGRQSESEHEELELLDLKPRKAKLRRGRLKSPKSPSTKTTSYSKSRTVLVEEPVLPGDTVQRVALRYGCRDSEIRRVNNLYRDQDFFALKVVKVPVREYGALTEISAREKCRQNTIEERGTESSGGATTSDEVRFGGVAAYYNSEEEPSCSSRDADDESGDSDTLEYRDISIQSAIRWKHTNNTLLQKLDEDLQRVRDETEKKITSAREVRFTMESPTILPVVYKNDPERNRLYNFILDWRTLLVAIVLLLIGAAVWVAMVIFTMPTQKDSKP